MPQPNQRIPFISLRQRFLDAAERFPVIQCTILHFPRVGGWLEEGPAEPFERLTAPDGVVCDLGAIGWKEAEEDYFGVVSSKEAVTCFGRLAHEAGVLLPTEMRPILPQPPTPFQYPCRAFWVRFLFDQLAQLPCPAVVVVGRGEDNPIPAFSWTGRTPTPFFSMHADGLRQTVLTINPFCASVQVIDLAILGTDDRRTAGPPLPPIEVDQYATLDQMAPMVNRSKKTLERYLRDGKMPPPDVEGGGGKAHEWLWSKIRPWLIQEFGRNLPERFPRG